MKNITTVFKDVYLPHKGLVFYQSQAGDGSYIESFDFDSNGFFMNAHPLSTEEAAALGKALMASPEMQKPFLNSKGLLPFNVLHINSGSHPHVIWWTPLQKVQLYFHESLGIPDGKAYIPSLVWKATPTDLYVFAYKGKERPELTSPLYHAPLFNTYLSGKVCMGTVDIDIANDCFLEAFTADWENWYFNSRFSHLLDSFCPVTENIVQLWKRLVNTNTPFPPDVLIKHTLTIKNLLS